MDPALPLIIPAPRPEHPLTGARRPVPVTVVILIGVLALMGWTEEQIVAVVAVLLSIGSAAALEARA